MRHLPDWIDAFMYYTHNSEAPELYRKWTAISTVAAALQRKCYLRWDIHLTYYPNLYVVLVGPTGARKGTAMAPGLDIIQEMGKIKLASQATTYQALVRKLKETNFTDVDIETGKTQFHASLTVFSKEFTVFLGFQNKELMSALCDWYDCDGRWVYETVSRKEEEIIGVWVNIIGATTPALIQSSMPMDAFGGGLASRIIYAFAPRKGKTVARSHITKDLIKLRQALIEDLDAIYSMSGGFKFTEGFADAWDRWYSSMESSPPIFNDDRLEGYISRRPTHAFKLSMVMAASRRDGPKMTVTEDDLRRTIETLVEVEKPMPYVFTGVGRSPISEVLPRVMAFIMEAEGDIPIWAIAERFYNDLDDVMLKNVLRTLETMNYIIIAKGRPHDKVRCIYEKDTRVDSD